MSKFKTYFAFIFLAFVWGASFIFMRIGVPELGAPAFASLRVGIAGVALLPVLLQAKHWQEYRENWLKLSLIGLLSTGLPFTLYAFATAQLNAGTAAVINASVPMLTGLIAHIFFKDYLIKKQLVGLIIGLLGVIVLMYDGMASGEKSNAWAFFMAVSACICYASGSNLAKHFLSGINPMTIASSGLLASGILASPIAIAYFPQHPASWQAWGAVVTIALFSTASAMIVYYYLIQKIGPTKTAVLSLLIPVFAILLGIIFLHETLTLKMLLGATIVLCGTGLTLFANKLPKKQSCFLQLSLQHINQFMRHFRS